MDTNLKRNKKIRACLYRIITAGALFTMLATALLGREAFINLKNEGLNTLTGDIYYLTEFREYISSLYTNVMLGYAGLGDHNGNPLDGPSAKNLSNKALTTFTSDMVKGKPDLAYYVEYSDVAKGSHNVTYPLFSQYDDHVLLPQNIQLCCYWNGPEDSLTFFPTGNNNVSNTPNHYYNQQYKPNALNTGKVQLILGIKKTDVYESSYLSELSNQAQAYKRILITFFSSAFINLLFGLLCALTGSTTKQVLSTFASFSQKIWLEGKLFALVGIMFLCYQLNLWHFNGLLVFRCYATGYLWLYFPTGILLYLFWVDLYQNKSSVWKHSLTHALFRAVKEYQSGLKWQRKAINVYIISLISAVTLFLSGILFTGILLKNSPFETFRRLNIYGIILLILGLLLFLCSIRLKRFINDVSAMTEKLSAIHAGDTDSPLSVSKNSLLKQAALDLEAVENGIETAVEQNNRSNRMRVELITNVSHDLKTPLTSIINYADLLCEENLSAPASEYASSLRKKAYRLKGMVQDVFELSKATSGNLPIEKTTLDLSKLVHQTLADMDERIQKSDLTFKLQITSEPLMIEADGEKLYRVFQNLIVNALQYSFENSRVYILLNQENGYVYAKIKNTSREELNFDPHEIIERFVRSDTSRTTEGSGLGLSIAQSFTEACGGTFSIELNADLFTACLRFPSV